MLFLHHLIGQHVITMGGVAFHCTHGEWAEQKHLYITCRTQWEALVKLIDEHLLSDTSSYIIAGGEVWRFSTGGAVSRPFYLRVWTRTHQQRRVNPGHHRTVRIERA